MEYNELKKYAGNRVSCHNCGRPFIDGEIITVSDDKKVFCYSDACGGCLIGYLFSTGNVLVGLPMKFGVGTLPAEKRTPRYPEAPVYPNKEKNEVKGFFQKITEFFR